MSTLWTFFFLLDNILALFSSTFIPSRFLPLVSSLKVYLNIKKKRLKINSFSCLWSFFSLIRFTALHVCLRRQLQLRIYFIYIYNMLVKRWRDFLNKQKKKRFITHTNIALDGHTRNFKATVWEKVEFISKIPSNLIPEIELISITRWLQARREAP